MLDNGSIISSTNDTSMHGVLFQVNVIVTSISSFGFVFISALLVFYHRGADKNKHNFNHPNHLILLFFGILSATITPLSVARTNNAVYSCYLVGIMAMIGIVLYVVGCNIFFEVSDTENPLCHKHPDVSLVLWVVAIPLVLLELFETISALKSSKVDFYFVGVRAVGLVQKLLQASFYHFNLRLKVARPDKKKGAGWFLVTMSLFNYAMWLDSIVTANDGTKYIVLIFGKGFSIVTTACVALLIDYRLLCCLLFAEHALDIQTEAKESDATQQQPQVESNVGEDVKSLSSICSSSSIGNDGSTNSFVARATQLSGFGYLFGFTCVSLQLICGLQYAGLIDHWANVFPIFADVSVMFFGVWFIRSSATPKDEDNSQRRETHSKAIDVMVAIMGVIGFLFWFIKTGLTISWSTRSNDFTNDQLSYLTWSAAKNSFRTVGILFQLYMFMDSDPLIGCRDEVRSNKLNFFMLPALMLSLLSVFIMTIIDSYNGFIEVLIEESDLDVVLTTLFKAGEPISLGFCLHVFLHFFITNSNMRNFKKSKEIQRLVRQSRPRSRHSAMKRHHQLIIPSSEDENKEENWDSVHYRHVRSNNTKNDDCNDNTLTQRLL